MKRKQRARREFGVFGTVALLCAPICAQVTQRVSLDSLGAQGNSDSGYYGLSISADGRHVVFQSLATNLVPGGTHSHGNVFERDLLTGQTSLVSVDSSGVEGIADSFSPSISADGRYVAFASRATNLVPSDTNGYADVFVRDRQIGLTSLVSVDSQGVQGNGDSVFPSISSDGRYVAFSSSATNLVVPDMNGTQDIFVRDRQTGQTSLVSLASSGAQGNGFSLHPCISGDGRYVAFDSIASNLVPGETLGVSDVFVRDVQSGQTIRASVTSAGAEANAPSVFPSISADGGHVAFRSYATNLTLIPDTNIHSDVFVHDLQTGQTSCVSVQPGGSTGDLGSSFSSISADGRFVAFTSFATNLVAGDANGCSDIFVRDRRTGETSRVSIDSAGAEADGSNDAPSISADGRMVAFSSLATDLVAGDTNGNRDVLVHDRDSTSFTSLCDPGVGGVISCPCSNAPSGAGRGCDNSAGTGGATIAASGVAYLSMDSLVFTTSGEKPTATSILLQGPASPPAGMVYGQGVRCVGGALKRLFVKTAVGGSITAPNFGAGDPTVSARAATLGDTIQAGQSRYYLVYYRDPIVLGGCPAASTFNATQTGQVAWSL